MAENDIRWIKTHCARMDHGGCGLMVGVKNNRIVKIKGDPQGFLNRGYACPKGILSAEKLGSKDRLRYPLRRVGDRGEGKWQRVSWKEAIKIIADNLSQIRDAYGARSVAFCQGMPKGLEHFVLIRLANIFGSPNVVATQDVCHAPREISGVHTCGFYPVADFHHKSELVVLWASNITATNEEGEICNLLLEQVRNGTQLVVVDPRKIALASKAKMWLQIRPGTDHALALAMLNVIIEENLYDKDFVEQWTYGFSELHQHVKGYTPERMSEATWIPPEQIRQAARLLATARPASIQWGNPIEQTTNAFHTARALICLMAITGNLDVPGGNIHAVEPNIMALGKFVRADLIPTKRKEMIHAYHGTIPRLMTVPPAFFREAVLRGTPYPVKAAYVQCANPLLAHAESNKTFEALMKVDFLAVSDLVMTPTASLADVVLPAATQFEFNDIGHYGLGHGIILARPKIVDPPQECWPDIKILNELGKAITDPTLWFEDYEDMLNLVLQPSGLTYDQFVEKGYLKGEERFWKYRQSGFKTPTGKVELRLTQAEKYGLSPLPRFDGPPEELDEAYPLVLTSAKSPNYLHSSYRWVDKLRNREPLPSALIHPDTATQYGIKNGQEIIIETRWGRIIQRASLTNNIHPKVVSVSHGWWLSDSGPEKLDWKRSNANMLTSAENVGREFGTPNLKGIACRITPV
ncbi:MAG: hypothetical protein DRG63_10470 [Deltaproteobacteria bacterium]|nr:MAG: hypothetical protein DRG63_10470 [Deltaproteobacteria bacterium]